MYVCTVTSHISFLHYPRSTKMASALHGNASIVDHNVKLSAAENNNIEYQSSQTETVANQTIVSQQILNWRAGDGNSVPVKRRFARHRIFFARFNCTCTCTCPGRRYGGGDVPLARCDPYRTTCNKKALLAPLVAAAAAAMKFTMYKHTWLSP